MQSYVTPYGYSSESCGYCKVPGGQPSPNTRASYYFSSKRLTVDVYQSLVDRGWRRSGTIFYKPDVLRHCCPHYTIRLPVESFKPAKDQKRAVHKWNEHVLGEEYIKAAARLYPLSKEEKTRLKTMFDLSLEVHKAEYQNVKRPPEPAHRFEVTLEPADLTCEKYELFHNYQKHVHKEKDHQISENGFKRFLCSSPLIRTTRQLDGKSQRLGSYHQCYRLDGRLIAMGVLDLLPHCVSGVYLLYHSDFEQWQFGKLSALREALLALEGGHEYYYMGYYIHSCTKMKYKGDYKMQHMLDPETYEWNPLDAELKQLLDQKTYVSLSRERRQRKFSAPLTNEGVEHSKGEEDQPLQIDLSEYTNTTAAQASAVVSSGTSLFDLKVPGLMTVEEVARQVDLDNVAISLGNRKTFVTSDLVSWEQGDIKDHNSVKGIIGELVAGIGPDVTRQVIVELG